MLTDGYDFASRENSHRLPERSKPLGWRQRIARLMRRIAPQLTRQLMREHKFPLGISMHHAAARSMMRQGPGAIVYMSSGARERT
jgi:hypothetical protein